MMVPSKMKIKKFGRLSALLLCLSGLAIGCAGSQKAIPLEIAKLRTNPTAAKVGFTTAVGVPSLAERVKARPGLKLAILQLAYKIEGRPEITFTTDVRSIGNLTTWKTTTTPEILVPTTLARQSGVDLVRALEASLIEQGFEIVSYESVANTRAYAKHYGRYPTGYNLENGWTVVGAHPLKVKKASNLIDYATLNWVWPDTKALPEIKSELGEDVLFLNLQVQIGTLAGGSSGLSAVMSVDVTDPDFVGYGVGGFGHSVVNLNANTGPKIPVPDFLARSGSSWKWNWTPVYDDLVRIHRAFALGFAIELEEMAHPSAQ